MWMMYLISVVNVGFVGLCSLWPLSWSLLVLMELSLRSLEKVAAIFQDLCQGIMGWEVVSILLKL